MYQRIIAVRDNTGYNGISLNVEGLRSNKIVSNVGKLALASTLPSTFEEIQKITELPVLFSGATEQEFREYVEIEKRITDPNGLFDDVFSYHLIDYILFDLVENKVIFPDYEQFEPDSNYFPVIEEPFESFYPAYGYSTANISDHDGIFQYSVENKLVFIQLGKVESIYNCEVKRYYLLQSLNKGSTPEEVSFCCACLDFNCNCTHDELEDYSLNTDNLPF